MNNYKSHFKHCLLALENKLHFAAHSHHLWPDSAKVGHDAFFKHSVEFLDQKWGHIFTHIVPSVRMHIARLIGHLHPEDIVLAPNTHELVFRLLSTFEKKLIKVLTTDSEFYSFDRQIKRMSELNMVEIETIKMSGVWDDRSLFMNEFKKALSKKPDIFFLSQVFFNSGQALTTQEILELYQAKSPETMMVVDGYHGFAALPFDMKLFKRDLFYLGGGYKYAMSGEGVAFMVVPHRPFKPMNTGWFAEFSLLEHTKTSEVQYSEGASAFWGATQDPSGWYRFSAVWDAWEENGIGPTEIHEHVGKLQTFFLERLPESLTQYCKLIKSTKSSHHGHFLTFEFFDLKTIQDFMLKAQLAGMLFDQRGLRLRIGFGLYHTEEDIQKLLKFLQK
jgi:selenocysteine lyase/cysteine desulfurase